MKTLAVWESRLSQDVIDSGVQTGRLSDCRCSFPLSRLRMRGFVDTLKAPFSAGDGAFLY
ncbi:hypothetical protein VSK92_13235 [Bacillus swezeyi]|uniref:hypothetical protein n=1 Tax=Bacillus swezeyi TaxID=1925020 RepID=UPI0039C5E2C9